MSGRSNERGYDRLKEDTNECPSGGYDIRETVKNVYTHMTTHDHRNCEKLIDEEKKDKRK
jgi:hypothetical protein